MLPAHSTPRIVSKEREKIDNYCDLKYEIKQIWNCCLLLVIPIVTGALEQFPEDLKCCRDSWKRHIV